MDENQSRLITYVKSLDRKVRDDVQFIKDNVEELKNLCRFISPEKNVPQWMIVDILEMYKNSEPLQGDPRYPTDDAGKVSSILPVLPPRPGPRQNHPGARLHGQDDLFEIRRGHEADP